MTSARLIPLILCGGAGRRLSPLSTPDNPKQFQALGLTQAPLLRETIDRIARCTDLSEQDMSLITTRRYADMAAQIAPRISPIIEDQPRNTGPAIAYAVKTLLETHPKDTLLWICPSDHTVRNETVLKTALHDAYPQAANGHIVTFGIPPDRPETGYGYIKAGADNRILHFTEKPDLQTAVAYLQNGAYLWNSGMFLASLGTYQTAFDTYAPDLLNTEDHISFDKAIMEKTKNGIVIPCPDMGWNDVGTPSDQIKKSAIVAHASPKGFAGHVSR